MTHTTPPLISIVLAFHNAAEYLPSALNQLQALTHPRTEIILVDDASTDSGGEVVRRWVASKNKEKARKVQVVTLKQRSGVAKARDAGIGRSTGEWVWMCDADDAWEADILCRMLEGAAHHPDVSIVCCRAMRVERPGLAAVRSTVMEGCATTTLNREGWRQDIASGRLRGYVWNKLFRGDVLRAAVRERSAHRERLSSQDDFLLLLDVLLHAEEMAGRGAVSRRSGSGSRDAPGGAAVCYVPFVGYQYRIHSAGISGTTAAQLDNTRHCMERAEVVLASAGCDARAVAGFRTWFYVVPALSTPVAQRWSRAARAAVTSQVTPLLTWRGIGAVWRLGQQAMARHAAVQRVTVPLGFYPAVYRAGRLGVALVTRLRQP